MAEKNQGFLSDLTQANVMPDGMLQGISYGDYALMMALKDRPIDSDNTSSFPPPENDLK